MGDGCCPPSGEFKVEFRSRISFLVRRRTNVQTRRTIPRSSESRFRTQWGSIQLSDFYPESDDPSSRGQNFVVDALRLISILRVKAEFEVECFRAVSDEPMQRKADVVSRRLSKSGSPFMSNAHEIRASESRASQSVARASRQAIAGERILMSSCVPPEGNQILNKTAVCPLIHILYQAASPYVEHRSQRRLASGMCIGIQCIPPLAHAQSKLPASDW